MAKKFKIEDRDYSLYSTSYSEDGNINDVRIAFEIGSPGVEALRSAAQLMLKATQIRLQKEISGDGDLLQYGSVLGDPAYRTNVAKFLSKHYMDEVDPASIMTTSGATIGLSLLANTFFSSGDYVFVEDPTYFRVTQIFGVDMGLQMVSIPLEDDGLNLEILEQEINRRKPKEFQPTAKRPFWALMYVVTIYQNPTGLCYSKDKCEKIVKLARDHNLLVVCDDVYNIVCYEKTNDTFESAPPRLLQYDTKSDENYLGNIVSNGSFSKILGPGLRLGWIEAPKVIMSRIMMDGCVLAGGSLNQYTSGIIGDSLNTDLFSDYILMVRNSGKKKLDAIKNVLQTCCPKNVKYSLPKGGYFMWLELPSSVDVQELNEFCLKTHNISFYHGIQCSASGGCSNCLRICFMYYSAERIAEALTKLLGEIKARLTETT